MNPEQESITVRAWAWSDFERTRNDFHRATARLVELGEMPATAAAELIGMEANELTEILAARRRPAAKEQA